MSRSPVHDEAAFLDQLLRGQASLWFAAAMQDSQDNGADGFDQNFGLNAVQRAASKQGWGCCLSGVLSIHSMEFTTNQIIVVLSKAPPTTSRTPSWELPRS